MAALQPGGAVDEAVFAQQKARFVEAMDNDLNTSLGITALYDVLKAQTNDATKLALLADFDQVLGLRLLQQAETARKAAAAGDEQEHDPEIEAAIAARKAAKKAKDYAEADRIRDALKAQGIELIDTPQGTTRKRTYLRPHLSRTRFSVTPGGRIQSALHVSLAVCKSEG